MHLVTLEPAGFEHAVVMIQRSRRLAFWRGPSEVEITPPVIPSPNSRQQNPGLTFSLLEWRVLPANQGAPGQRDCPRFLDELYRVCSTARTTRLSEDTASELLVMCGGECELSIQLGIFEVRLGARPINVILGGIRL
jgi:hypothetical protein